MIDLQSLCSLPITFNNQKEKLVFGDELILESAQKVPLKSLIPSLLNKSLIYPVEVYEEYTNIRRVEHKDSLKYEVHYDLMMIPEGLLGVEYIKSHIYFSEDKCAKNITACVVEVIHGTLTVLLQRNVVNETPNFYTEVQEGILVEVRKGEKAIIPTGYFYTFINTTEQPVIFSILYRNKSVVDYSKFRKEQGLAYFCIRKNGRSEIVKNPRYRNIPEIKKMNAKDTLNSDFISDQTPLYSQMLDRVEMLLDMLW